MSARQAARWKRAACPALARDAFSKSKIWGRHREFGIHLEGSADPSKPPDGWCGREARRRSVPGGTCRVSCVRWALETLAPPPFAAKTADATASVGWVWDPPASERRPSPYRAQRGRPLMAAARAKQHISERRPSPYRAQRGRPLTAAARAKQLFTQKRLTRRKDGAIIPASNAEGGRAGMKAARMDHSSAYYFTFSFTFARKALLRCAV